MFRWAVHSGCEQGRYIANFAAEGGNLDIIKMLTDQGEEWNDKICSILVSSGHLEVLKWAKDSGWYQPTNNKRIFALATRGGNLDMLCWLRENGFPWDITAYYEPARLNRVYILQWLKDNGCPHRAENRHLWWIAGVRATSWVKKNNLY